LADNNDTSFDADDMLEWLNEGCQRFASETHCAQYISQLSAVSSSSISFATIQGEYAYAKDVLQILKVEIIDTDGDWFLDFAPVFDKKTRLSTAETVPDRYSVFAETIILNTNSQASLSIDMNVYFSYVPTVVEASHTVLIPAEWHHAIVKYIMFCAFLSTRDMGAANGSFEEYDEIRKTAQANVFARIG